MNVKLSTSVSEDDEHARSRPALPAERTRNQAGLSARSALLGALRRLVGAPSVCVLATLTTVAALQSSTHGQSPAAAQKALVDRYCVTCHNDRAKTGGLTLQPLALDRVPEAAETWEKVARKLRGGMMPPPGMPRPDQASLDALVAHLESSIDAAALANPNPGHSPL